MTPTILQHGSKRLKLIDDSSGNSLTFLRKKVFLFQITDFYVSEYLKMLSKKFLVFFQFFYKKDHNPSGCKETKAAWDQVFFST